MYTFNEVRCSYSIPYKIFTQVIHIPIKLKSNEKNSSSHPDTDGGWTDGRTEEQGESSIPSLNFVAGGLISCLTTTRIPIIKIRHSQNCSTFLVVISNLDWQSSYWNGALKDVLPFWGSKHLLRNTTPCHKENVTIIYHCYMMPFAVMHSYFSMPLTESWDSESLEIHQSSIDWPLCSIRETQSNITTTGSEQKENQMGMIGKKKINQDVKTKIHHNNNAALTCMS